MRIVTVAGVGVLVVLCVLRRDDLATAIGSVPPGALAALAALHLTSLVARSEAWRLSLAALSGTPPSRAAIHSANAGAFVAGSLEPHAAMPARVALLRRLAPGHVPHATHIAVADVPIFLLEVAGAAALLGLTGTWWAPPAAVAVLVGARLAAGRRATRGLAVLADRRRRGALAVLVACVVGCGLARVWLVLAVVHLDATPAAAAAAFTALGIFGLLPLGPSAPPGALLLVSGGAGALAAGLALSATSIGAVLVYAAVLSLAGDRTKARRKAVEVEGAEAVEEGVGGAVEVGRARREQAALRAALRDERGLLRVVGRVEGLDAVEARRLEPIDGVQDGRRVLDVPERMRPDGDAAGLVHERDRLGDGRDGPAAVRGGAGDEIGLEQLRSVHDLLALEADAVGGMVERRLGEMRTADGVAPRQVELQAGLAQRVGHPLRAGGAVGAEGDQGVEQDRGVVIDQVAEDMEVLGALVEGGDLDPGYESQAARRARFPRLVDAVHRVMVGERQQGHAGLRGRRHHGAWR